MRRNQDVSGAAALSICESLLLCLTDRAVLTEQDVIGILEDAATAHDQARDETVDRDVHLAAAMLIRRIIAGGNSVRRR